MLRDQSQAVVEVGRKCDAVLEIGAGDLGRDLEDGAVRKQDRVRVDLANDGRPFLEERQPEVGTELGRTTLHLTEVVGPEKLARLDVPDAVLRPDAGAEFPARIATPSPRRSTALLSLRGKPCDGALRVDDDGPVALGSERARFPILDLHPLAHAHPHRLQTGGHRPDAQDALLAVVPEILDADVAGVRFVERVPPDDGLVEEVARIGESFAELAVRVEKVRLQVVLDVDSVDDALRSVLASGKEERKDGLNREPSVICRPDHFRECDRVGRRRVGPLALDDGSARLGKVLRLEPASENRPVRRAGPAREPRPLRVPV